MAKIGRFKKSYAEKWTIWGKKRMLRSFIIWLKSAVKPPCKYQRGIFQKSNMPTILVSCFRRIIPKWQTRYLEVETNVMCRNLDVELWSSQRRHLSPCTVRCVAGVVGERTGVWGERGSWGLLWGGGLLCSEGRCTGESRAAAAAPRRNQFACRSLSSVVSRLGGGVKQ